MSGDEDPVVAALLFLPQDPHRILRHIAVPDAVIVPGVLLIDFRHLIVLQQNVRQMCAKYGTLFPGIICGHAQEFFPEIRQNRRCFLSAHIGSPSVPVPQVFQIGCVQPRGFRCFQQIPIIVVPPLHVKAEEAKVVPFFRRFVIAAHPGNQILHFLCPVNGETDGRRRFRCRAFAPVDVAVDRLASAEVPFNGERPDAVSFHQYLEHVELQCLEFPVPVGRFPQTNDAGPFRNRQLRNRCRVFCKLFRVCTFTGAEAPKVGINNAGCD